MIVSGYMNEFVLFSFLGWIYECIYCTFRIGHWQNRGFLFGPVCPIYGAGVVIADVLFGVLSYYTGIAIDQISSIVIFLICMFGSGVLEYVTSYVLEKRFHAMWWDYSRVPLNIRGRVSLPTSAGFGAAGLLIVRFVLPLSHQLMTFLPGEVSIVLSLLFAAILGADLALTEASLSDLLSRLETAENELNTKMEKNYLSLEQKGKKLKDNITGLSRKLYGDQAAELADGLSLLQKNLMNNIRNFRARKTSDFADSIQRQLQTVRQRKK